MISFTKFIKEEDDEAPHDYEAEEKHIKKALDQDQEARRKANEIPSGAEIRAMLSDFRAKHFPDQTKLNLNTDKRNP
jgi:hypothetical protein